MNDFWAARWWLFFLGGLAGVFLAVAWLLEHHWNGWAVRLLLTPLGGAVVLGLVGEGVFWLGRGRSLAARAARPGRWAAEILLAPLLPLTRESAAFWRLALAALLLTLGGFAWWEYSQVNLGQEKVREVFERQKGRAGDGLFCLLSKGVDGAGPWQEMGNQRLLDFSPRTGAPGGEKEDFRLCFLGMFLAERAGEYRLGGLVDDGLAIIVDGRAVTREMRGGPPREVWGKVRLSKGWHALEIRYMQLKGRMRLLVLWQPPGGKPGLLPASRLAPLRPPAPLAQLAGLRLKYGLGDPPPSTYPPLQSGRFWKLPW